MQCLSRYSQLMAVLHCQQPASLDRLLDKTVLMMQSVVIRTNAWPLFIRCYCECGVTALRVLSASGGCSRGP